jgi:hypothetical protein
MIINRYLFLVYLREGGGVGGGITLQWEGAGLTGRLRGVGGLVTVGL